MRDVFVYVPAVTAVFSRASVIVPLVVTGPPVDVSPVPPLTPTLVTVPLPDTVAQVLSPRKNVELSAVPVADRSPVMVPVVVIVPPLTFTKVPFEVATLVTVPEPPLPETVKSIWSSVEVSIETEPSELRK